MTDAGGSAAGLRSDLVRELEADVKSARGNARRNYYTAYALTAAAVCASIAAGMLGLFGIASREVVGMVALVPGAATLIMQTLKFQARADLFYALHADLDSIRSRARYSELDCDNAGALASEAAERRRRFGDDWTAKAGFEGGASKRLGKPGSA